MLLRIHRSAENHEVVGICDRELIGRTLREGAVSISINADFFGDTSATEEDIIRVLDTGDNITMFGERCISLAIRHGTINEESCKFVEGIPYATIIRL